MREFFSVKQSLAEEKVLAVLRLSLPLMTPDEQLDYARRIKDDEQITAIGVTVDNDIIGVAVYRVQHNKILLKNIAVAEDYRSKGFGKALLSVLISEYNTEKIVAEPPSGADDGFLIHYGFVRSEKHPGRLEYLIPQKGQKPTLRDRLRYEDRVMSDRRRRAERIVIPAYVVSGSVLLILFFFLLQRNVIAAMIVLAALALLTVGLIVILLKTRSSEFEQELRRYDFCEDRVEERDSYEFSTDGHLVEFNRYGMVLDSELIYYNHMKIFIMTENVMNRIVISVVFRFSDDAVLQLPLNATVIKMIHQFDIPLVNRKTLDYLIDHKREAFKEIYNSQ